MFVIYNLIQRQRKTLMFITLGISATELGINVKDSMIKVRVTCLQERERERYINKSTSCTHTSTTDITHVIWDCFKFKEKHCINHHYRKSCKNSNGPWIKTWVFIHVTNKSRNLKMKPEFLNMILETNGLLNSFILNCLSLTFLYTSQVNTVYVEKCLQVEIESIARHINDFPYLVFN